MKITMLNSQAIHEVNGTPCRVWEGKTEKGVPCLVYVAAIAVEDGRHQQFAEELEALTPPKIAAVLAPRPPGQDWR